MVIAAEETAAQFAIDGAPGDEQTQNAGVKSR
jgi:hypothetical protein